MEKVVTMCGLTPFARMFLVTSLVAVIASAGCVHPGNLSFAMSPSDLRGMVAMLQAEAPSQSSLLEALTSTPEYHRFAEDMSISARSATRFVCMLREYEGGIFGAVYLFESNSITRATWMPIHKRGQNTAVQTVAVDSKRAAVVWKIIECPPWTTPPVYRSFRVNDETSPAPYFLALRTRGPTAFHCAVFTHHEPNYSQLFEALMECVGSTDFAGDYRMLVLSPDSQTTVGIGAAH